jgi:hypothetical protein
VTRLYQANPQLTGPAVTLRHPLPLKIITNRAARDRVYCCVKRDSELAHLLIPKFKKLIPRACHGNTNSTMI